MALDKRGDIAVAEVVLYVPILIVSVILIFRHGFTRQAGWIFLLLLSVGKCRPLEVFSPPTKLITMSFKFGLSAALSM